MDDEYNAENEGLKNLVGLKRQIAQQRRKMFEVDCTRNSALSGTRPPPIVASVTTPKIASMNHPRAG